MKGAKAMNLFDEDANYEINSAVVGSEFADTIENFAGGSTILAGDGNDYVFSSTLPELLIGKMQYGYVTIEGGGGDDTIISHDPHVMLDGGDGNDFIDANGWDYVTMRGGLGNDTLIGSVEKAELFQYEGGNDLIVGFNASDTLQLPDGTEFSTMRGNSDMIVSIGECSVTLQNAAAQSLNVAFDGASIPINYDGVKLNASGKTLKIKTPFTGTIRAEDFGDKIKTLNASTARNAVELIGNDLNNVLKASKGGSTISGGLGNDKITCGKGEDLIVYSGGNDVIKKFDATQDTIRIADGEIGDVRIKGKNVVMSIGEGTLTVQKAVGQELTIIDANGIESTYVFMKGETLVRSQSQNDGNQ